MQAQLGVLFNSQIHFSHLRSSRASLLLISGLIGSGAHAAQVTFRWDYAASGAAGFVLYCGPSTRSYPTRVDVGNTDTYTIGTLQEGATSYCAVTAYDPAKVESAYSVELAHYVPYAVPVVGFSASPGSGTVPLSVAFTNATTGLVTSWAWDFGDGTSGSLKNPTHAYSMPGSYKATLTATGPGGTASMTATTAITVSATSGSDTLPPSIPAGLTATAVSASRIDLTWSASTDNVGVKSYRVERCRGPNCTNFVQVAQVTGVSFSSTGLVRNARYRFRVRAVDAAGNSSGYSSVVGARTLNP